MYTPEEAKALRETNPFDTRNVREKFKGMPTEDIKAELTKTQAPIVLIVENLIRDFNLAQIVRAANGFNCQAVYICGNKSWDRRGAVGTHHYIDIVHWDHIQDAIAWLRMQGYTIIAAEDTPTAIKCNHVDWPEKTGLVLGEEGRGISAATLEMVDITTYIPMRGSVPSFNVAGAAQILLYEYMVDNDYI